MPDGKQPYLIRLKNGEPMGFGGLLEHWHGPDGEIVTFTILTTAANRTMAQLHDRIVSRRLPPEQFASQ